MNSDFKVGIRCVGITDLKALRVAKSSIDFCVWNADDLLQLPKKEVDSFRKDSISLFFSESAGLFAPLKKGGFNSKNLPQPFLNRILFLQEAIQVIRPKGVIIRLPVWSWETLDIVEVVSWISKKLELPLWLDPGKQPPSIETLKLSTGIHWILDPMWHPSNLLGTAKMFCLHGWHPSRWVRFFGDKQLKTVNQRIRRHKVSYLFLAHSQRILEVRHFLKDRE